jgi:D-arabinose 1-dehydrogenase-like Zn-dependent alcohol dehydrogenase
MPTIQGYACKKNGQPLELWEYEAAPLRPTDIHIEISHCGICHSDIHTLDSGWGPTDYPVIVGHEIVGIVTEVGPEVSRFKVGDRVGIGAQSGSCHRCKECRTSTENCCKKGVFTYNAQYPDGHKAYGGYAAAWRGPSEFAFKIPDSLPSAEAAPLLCAGVTVFAPLKRHMKPACTVGVVGIGGLGHLALQFAKALGSSQVTAITSTARKAKDAVALGADRILESSNPEQMAAARGSIDLIICTVSSHQIVWESYLSLLSTNGKLVILGVPEQPITLNVAALIFSQVSMVGSLIGSPAEIEEMLEFAAKKKVLPWIQKAPMSQVNEALTNVRNNNVRFRYVLEN